MRARARERGEHLLLLGILGVPLVGDLLASLCEPQLGFLLLHLFPDPDRGLFLLLLYVYIYIY